MNTENDRNPDDPQLSAIYRQTEQDMPAKHIDDAILAAAQHETKSQPHPAGPFSHNWRISASLAAVLVLSFGIVSLMDNELDTVDGVVPLAIDEVGRIQTPIEPNTLSDSTAEEPKRIDTPSKPAMRSLAAPAKHKPAAKSPATVSEQASTMEFSQGMSAKQEQDKRRKEQVARKKKHTALVEAEATDRLSAAAMPSSAHVEKRVTAVPDVETIIALRKMGKLLQANQAADGFIQYYFNDSLNELKPVQVKLTREKWIAFIVELRALGRNNQANSLAKLLDK